MNTNAVQSFPAGEDIGIHLRVVQGADGKMYVADAADAAEVLGHNAYSPVDASQKGRDIAAVQLKHTGVHYAVAAGEITLASPKFKGADGGKIQAHGGSGTAEGVVRQAAAGDGSIVEAVYF